MEGDEGCILSKAPDLKSLFLLKIKIKRNSGCPNKEYNAIFKHINIRTSPRSKKKSGLINDWENIVAYWEAAQPQENFAMFFFI